jgi:YVTN family beta-propeller protein
MEREIGGTAQRGPRKRTLRRVFGLVGIGVIFVLITAPVVAGIAPELGRLAGDPVEPGRGKDDSVRLINQRLITPAGRQSLLGDLPLNAILTPDGHHLLVANSGAGPQSLQVVDTASGAIVQEIKYFSATGPDSVFVGLAYSPDGKRVFASGGGSNVIHTFSVGNDARLTATGDFNAGPVTHTQLGDAPWPIGLSISPDGSMLYVANNLDNTVRFLDSTTGALKATVPVGSYPYTTLASQDGKRVYVSNWGDATVSAIDVASRSVVAAIKVGDHPSAMAFGPHDFLYVADSNSDAISAIQTSRNREVKRFSLAPYKGAQLSSSPEGLAVSPDGSTLYVANAGADEIVVVDLDPGGEPENVRGRIPTAWYPTSVVTSLDGRTLYVTNAKGTGAGPNGGGLDPQPTRKNPPIVDGVTGYNDSYCQCTFDKYTGSMMIGTLSSIDVPRAGLLRVYTQQVMRNNNYPTGDDGTAGGASKELAADAELISNGRSPIAHVIYIIKENRTFDQVFGDEPIGDTDSSLTLFPRATTPNLHALTERFGILDNFYADAEVSADGHNWATSANATDYNEKMWPQDYSAAFGRNRGYDFEGGTTINISPGGYIWDAAAAAHVSLRNYGEFANNGSQVGLIPESQAGSCPGPIARAYAGVVIPAGQVLCFGPTTVNATTTPNLIGTVDPKFRGYDLRYPEADRVREWQREFNAYVASGTLPRLQIMRLPNDHTAGTFPGARTPQAYVAENDLAVGQVVETVSHSPVWDSTAIFITEDDAQNGPDHVDAHRTTSLLVTPYTSRETPRVDHTLYDTSAMLRTIELLLGLKPLSQYDANATPMSRLFSRDLTDAQRKPYIALPETVSMTDINTAQSFGAELSAKLDFEVEDRAPMAELNAIIWHAVKGADVPYPQSAAEGEGPHEPDDD